MIRRRFPMIPVISVILMIIAVLVLLIVGGNAVLLLSQIIQERAYFATLPMTQRMDLILKVGLLFLYALGGGALVWGIAETLLAVRETEFNTRVAAGITEEEAETEEPVVEETKPDAE
jgi:hypothetical protein